MTTANDIWQRNQITLSQRAEIWRNNRRPEFSSRELVEMPPYIGFVEARLFEELTFVMFLCDGDDDVAHKLLWNGYYEPMSLGVWALLAKQSPVVFDVGAHTGVYSLIAHLTNPQATVVSCEPHEVNYARLVVNLRANELPRDMAYPVAVSNIDDFVPFNVLDVHWYLSSGGSVGGHRKPMTKPVLAIQLDTTYRENKRKIALIKIDTEGHEPSVIEGAKTMIAECVPDILMESVFNPDTASLDSFFRQLGYSFYIIDDHQCMLTPVETLAPSGTAAQPDMMRLNRLITRRSYNEILDLAKEAKQRLCINAICVANP